MLERLQALRRFGREIDGLALAVTGKPRVILRQVAQQGDDDLLAQMGVVQARFGSWVPIEPTLCAR
jgi:hypothetical protein